MMEIQGDKNMEDELDAENGSCDYVVIDGVLRVEVSEISNIRVPASLQNYDIGYFNFDSKMM